MVEKRKKLRIGKKKYPFHQPIRRQHSDLRCNISKLSLMQRHRKEVVVRHTDIARHQKKKKKPDKTQNKNMTRKIIITNLVLFSINNRHVGKKWIKACKHTSNQ